MRLWLLDADVVIKFLEIDVFDTLAAQHELHVASSVEKLLSISGLTVSPKHKLDVRLSEAYFRSNLDEGEKDFIYSIGKQ